MRIKGPSAESLLEQTLKQQLDLAKITYVREFRPIPTRRWRVDFLIGQTLVVEVEGGIWSRGRHTRGGGFEDDAEKYNTLTVHGYRVLRVTGSHIGSGAALKWIEAAVAS